MAGGEGLRSGSTGFRTLEVGGLGVKVLDVSLKHSRRCFCAPHACKKVPIRYGGNFMLWEGVNSRLLVLRSDS